LSYLNKLGRKLRGAAQPTQGSGTNVQTNGVIDETFEEDANKITSDDEP
jgi:hypothetical protein